MAAISADCLALADFSFALLTFSLAAATDLAAFNSAY
jgi:hypothetical protein